MLYTRKGDGGTTKVLDSKERFSKASALAEALGSLDELNSFLGLCKVKARGMHEMTLALGRRSYMVSDLLHETQKNLFILQAQVAGASKKLGASKAAFLERAIDTVEREIPPLRSFSIAGGTELSALLDVARTIARRTERRIVEVHETGLRKLPPTTLAYANRLSSFLFALARLVNHRSGITEQSPDYR